MDVGDGHAAVGVNCKARNNVGIIQRGGARNRVCMCEREAQESMFEWKGKDYMAVNGPSSLYNNKTLGKRKGSIHGTETQA